MVKVCVVIPVLNEAAAIAEVVRAARAKVPDVVVVNDGSTDGCGELAKSAGAHVINLPKRNGKGFALQQGFNYAREKGFDGVIAMDGDGQHAPGDLDVFLEMIAKAPDSLIVGNRLNNAANMPFVRKMTNRFMSWLISLACGQPIPDTQCGYRYLGMNVINAVRMSTKSYEIETEMLMKSAKKGIRIHSVPVETIYRQEKSHIRPFRDTMNFIAYYIRELFLK